MGETSVILKDNVLISRKEFRVFDYIPIGKIWWLNQQPTIDFPYKIQYRVSEYIFDPETFTMFCMISHNILAYWNTDFTRNIQLYEEYYITESLIIRPYVR